MNPATLAVGTSLGGSALSQMLGSVFGAPRRAAYNAIDTLTGGTVASDDQNGITHIRDKSAMGMLPALLGIIGGGATGLGALGAAAAPWAIPLGLLVAGAAQRVGEPWAEDAQPNDFTAPETSRLLSRLTGTDVGEGTAKAVEMIADPMNLLGLPAWKHAGTISDVASTVPTMAKAALTEGPSGLSGAVREMLNLPGSTAATQMAKARGALPSVAETLPAMANEAPAQLGQLLAERNPFAPKPAFGPPAPPMSLLGMSDAERSALSRALEETSVLPRPSMRDLLTDEIDPMAKGMAPITMGDIGIPMEARTMHDFAMPPVMPVPQSPTSAFPVPSKMRAPSLMPSRRRLG